MPESLRFLLPVRHRHGDVTVALDSDARAGHIVESLGIPRTEIGELRVNGALVDAHAQPRDGDRVEVVDIHRPQRHADPRFLLDVHLGTLARRMRLLGIDTAYSNDADDPELVEQAVEQGRILPTQDRGLLRRTALQLPAALLARGARHRADHHRHHGPAHGLT